MIRFNKIWMTLFLILFLSAQIVSGGDLETRLSDGSFQSGPVFVLLYHPWEEGFEPTFRAHLSWLKQNEYQTIPLETLIDYLEGKEVSLPPNPILLTFDDGSMEDHETVYPILKEFDYAGTSFVITGLSFTFNSNKSWWREVDRSSILRIENHSHSHGLIWVSPSIVDFYTGTDPGDYYLIKGMDSRLGAPIYEFGYELIHERYFPDQRIANLCVTFVAQNGGEDFFKKEGWREELRQVAETFRNQYQEQGRYEEDARKEIRLKTEIYWSKKIIELNIGPEKEVNYFAYPWGVYDEALILQLKGYGYRGAFTANWSGANYLGDDPFKIKRVIITSDMTEEDLALILDGY